MPLISEHTCPLCGTDVQTASDSSRVTCPDCGYHIIEPEPDGGVWGYE